MKEISQEVLDHMPDPIARMVWERWIEDGTARLKTYQSEGQKCRATTR
ncbi:hypothetical protein [Methanofollis fontis]|nr:hypothetical protein [Methanofollis fontis]